MHELIYDLVKAQDLLEVKEILTKIDDSLTKQEIDRTIFCKELSAAIYQWAIVKRLDKIINGEKPNYLIYLPHESMPYYLASRGLALGRVRDMRKNIKVLITYITNKIIIPTGNFLTYDEEEMILSILGIKFPYWEIVSKKGHLTILNINNTNRDYNAICAIDENVTSYVIDMYNLNDKNIKPGYVFLHELGHVLQISITGSSDLVPDEFIQFNKLIEGVGELRQGEIGIIDIFADTFAIAVMYGTELKKLDPFHLPAKLNKLLFKFYEGLFKKYHG